MDRVTGFEIPVNNLKRAQKFFKKVLGWKVSAVEKNYTHVETAVTKNWESQEKGAVNGGLFKREKAKEHPLLIVEVKSIDKSLKKARAEGGKVVTGKTPISDWGFWAVFEDTEGNQLELREYKS